MSMHTHYVADNQSGTGVGSLHEANGGCEADLSPPDTLVGGPNLGNGDIVGRSVDSNSWLSTDLARARTGAVGA